jgi:hypothetical protein
MLGRDNVGSERTEDEEPPGPKDVVKVKDQVVLRVDRAMGGSKGRGNHFLLEMVVVRG